MVRGQEIDPENQQVNPAIQSSPKWIGLMFKAEMVRAIVAGVKTQTRRKQYDFPSSESIKSIVGTGYNYMRCDDWRQPWNHRIVGPVAVACEHGAQHIIECPYGSPGDKIWVKETYAPGSTFDSADSGYLYRAEIEGNAKVDWKWRSAMLMPKSACRIGLEIVDTEFVELHSIDLEDAIAEGVEFTTCAKLGFELQEKRMPLQCHAYAHYWNEINGKGSWDRGGWTWKITFKKIDELPEPKR